MHDATRKSFNTTNEIPGNPNTIRDAFFDPVTTYATIARPETPETETRLLARERHSLGPSQNRTPMRLKEVRGKYAR